MKDSWLIFLWLLACLTLAAAVAIVPGCAWDDASVVSLHFHQAEKPVASRPAWEPSAPKTIQEIIQENIR